MYFIPVFCIPVKKYVDRNIHLFWQDVTSGCLRGLFLQNEAHHLCDFIGEKWSQRRDAALGLTFVWPVLHETFGRPFRCSQWTKCWLAEALSFKKRLLERERVTDLLGCGDDDAFRSAKAHRWWTVKDIIHHKKREKCAAVCFTQVFDTRQHVGCEVRVWGDLPFRWSNADVGLVDPQAAGLLWPRVDLLERKPELDRKSAALNKKHCFKCSWLGWGREDFPCVYATTTKSNKDFEYVKNKRQMGFIQLEKNKTKTQKLE